MEDDRRKAPEIGTPGAIQSAFTGHLPTQDEAIQPTPGGVANTGDPGPVRAGPVAPAPDDPNRRMVTPQDDAANPNKGNTDPNEPGPQGEKEATERTQINPPSDNNAPSNAQGPAAAKSAPEAQADKARTGTGANAPSREGPRPGERS